MRVFESLVSEGDVVFDVGAHAGYYTLVASKLVGPSGTVVAFEPLPQNLEYLSRHVTINGANNVKLVEGAVWSGSGSLRFQPHEASSSMGHVSSSGQLLVEAFSIDDFAVTRGLSPNVIKIDVEGAEEAVLRGADKLLAKCSPLIFLAVHSDELRLSCTELLQKYGFRVEALDDENSIEASELLAFKGHSPW